MNVLQFVLHYQTPICHTILCVENQDFLFKIFAVVEFFQNQKSGNVVIRKSELDKESFASSLENVCVVLMENADLNQKASHVRFRETSLAVVGRRWLF